MGNVKVSEGDEDSLDQGFTYHERALAQYEATIGDHHHRTADVRCRVAEHHIRYGQYEDAR